MKQMFKALEAPSLEGSFGAPTSEYGDSSGNSLSRYLQQHIAHLSHDTGSTTSDAQLPEHLDFDWDQPVGTNFIQHHNIPPVVSKKPFVYLTHPGRGLEGTAYIPCSLVSTSRLFDVEAVERDGVRALLPEEIFPPPASTCLQPVDTTMSTGLSWEFSGSNLSRVPRAINEASALLLPTYVSAFGTGMDLDRDYEHLSQEEEPDYDLPTFTVSNVMSPTRCRSAAACPIRSLLKKKQVNHKKSSTSRKHSLPSISRSPLYSPTHSDISPYSLREKRHVTAKRNDIFQESLSASLQQPDEPGASLKKQRKEWTTSGRALESELGGKRQRMTLLGTQLLSQQLGATKLTV
ncbi:uncharacterized protein BT62DRAFT_990702 [Guyanagaster necrorhizus]|uniref:Uncharacterized protein n=1 Tax=Guyanagaster necrorhizus TaxID=856835 RepID=A0A9P8AYK8_9AGAR|nr:uncharacterized protein BT62DRAFT_990702 [Guyanagaster necrorhizus MCA 3950]KAG7451027.1 hypothetical protein BT62DRAFT_990702 [Guyanagaster necrorhizus MCA 3950]